MNLLELCAWLTIVAGTIVGAATIQEMDWLWRFAGGGLGLGIGGGVAYLGAWLDERLPAWLRERFGEDFDRGLRGCLLVVIPPLMPCVAVPLVWFLIVKILRW